jgi:hypothetical protein
MQRAAASSPLESSSPEGYSSKKRKHDSISAPSPADRQVYQKAVEDEEAKRIAALEKQFTDTGESRWVLSYNSASHKSPSTQVVLAGFATIDGLDETDTTEETIPVVGRRSFGGFKRQKDAGESLPSANVAENSEDENLSTSDSRTSDGSDLDGISDENTNSRQKNKMNDKIRFKSISGGNEPKCSRCGSKGHSKAACPLGRSKGTTSFGAVQKPDPKRKKKKKKKS